MKNRNHIRVFCLTAILSAWLPAYAEQRIPAEENVPHKVTVSRDTLSRIAIDGGRIKNAKYLDGDLEIEKDASLGQVYVRALTNRTSSLFVTSDQGKTYLLLLQPTGRQGDNIVIDAAAKERAAIQAEAAKERGPVAVTSKATDYVRAIKQMMTAMMSGTANSMGVKHSPTYETIPLWQNTLFVKTVQYTAADMMGESYTLTNIGSDQLVLREQEFYRPDVYAVAARKHILNPGEMTEVFVIRRWGAAQ